jgi:hypothetical protein
MIFTQPETTGVCGKGYTSAASARKVDASVCVGLESAQSMLYRNQTLRDAVSHRKKQRGAAVN